MSEATIDRAWALMKSIRFCMFSTWHGHDLLSRPMAAFVSPGENAVYFFADVRRKKDDQIEQNPRVHLAFAHPFRQKYVSLLGSAEVTNDRNKIVELWSIAPKLWWDSPDDPNIRIIKVVPRELNYWDSPSTWISNLKVAFGLLVGRHPDPGDRRTVIFDGEDRCLNCASEEKEK